MKPLLLKHLSGEPIGRNPVWLMRQAGRYLPRYQEIRAKHSFWEMVTKPEIATEVSLLPLEVLPVDAVIFFSDILSLPYGRGVNVEMRESVGPVLPNPMRTLSDFDVFLDFSPEKHVPFVGETLTRIREKIPQEKTLLGFAGAPWTLSCYLVEGGGSAKGRFESLRRWESTDPKVFLEVLSRVTDATMSYLLYQHRCGAHAVQLFDTWASEMPLPFFREHYVPLLNRIFDGLRAKNIPTIYFAKHSHHLDAALTALHCDVLSCDDLVPMPEMEKRTENRFSLQGNFDPVLLNVADEGIVRRQTRKLVDETRQLSRPAIINLGHGVLPKTPVKNVLAFVQEAQALWI